MRRCEQTEPATWLTNGVTPWPRLATFGPAGFEAYARLRFIPDPSFVGQRESEVEMDEDRPSDFELARRTLVHLSRFTETLDECFVCVPENHRMNAADARGVLVHLEHRTYELFTGPLDDVMLGDELLAGDPALVPAFVWPADRRWCFASDVDPHWAGIGAERAAVDAIVAATDIDVVRADPRLLPVSYA